MNRREFLNRTGLAGFGAASAGSLLSLSNLSQVAAQSGGSGTTGYRALVCILLSGGNDSFNMLVPRPHADPTGNWSGVDGSGSTGESEWQAYCNLRGSVGIPAIYTGGLGSTVLPLYKADASLHSQALNGNMPRLQAIFNGQSNATYGMVPTGRHAALVANVGTLIRPVTAAEVRNKSKLLPLHLGSHSDQIAQWQTCFPQGQSASGWAGRLQDEYSALSTVSPYAMISLDGQSTMLTGKRLQHFSDGAGNAFVGRVSGYPTYGYQARREKVQQILHEQLASSSQSNLLSNAYLEMMAGALDRNVEYTQFVENVTVPSSGLTVLNMAHDVVGRARRLAKIIKAFESSTDPNLPKRQVFFLNFGGWDHHSGLAGPHQTNLSVLDSALGEFYMIMKNASLLEKVTVFTASDFGRALVPNGDGTDHAWGGNHIVMGGMVNGGDIYGHYPKLKVQGGNISAANSDSENLDIYGNGVMMPTLPVDVYVQRLGKWLLQGTPAAAWADNPSSSNNWTNILPNWPHLWDYNSSLTQNLTV